MATLSEKRLKDQKRKKWKFLLIATMIEVVISPLPAYVLHQVLDNIRKYPREPLSFNYFEAIISCIQIESVQLLWMVLELAWAAFVLYLSISITPQLSKVDQMQVTEDISIPVPAGNGQHGSERFLREDEKEELFEVFKFSGTETFDKKGGIVVQMTKKKGVEQIFYLSGDIHSLIFGATRAGKTRRILLETMWLQIMSGISVICSDVKGELFYYTSPFARAHGYKVYDMDLRKPEKSIHYNFLQPIIDAKEQGDLAKAIDYTWDLVSVLVGEQKGEPLWYNGETATIAAVILIVVCEAPKKFQNLTNVYYFLSYMCTPDDYGNTPINAYLESLPQSHPAVGVFKMATIAPFKTRSSFYTSALGTLRLFTNPKVAEMTSKSDINLKDIGREKSILYMMIPDEKKTLYPLVSLFVTQAYMLQVELANENGLRLPVDTDYDLDEAGNFPKIPILGNILSAGASRGVRANLVIQDYQQLESKYKEDFKNIRTNCQLKIYLKSDDNDTLKNISDSIGDYTVEVSSASSSLQDGKKSSVNLSSSASLAGRKLMTTAELRRIKSPYSVCMLTGEYAGINILPDLSEYRANRMMGLGDQNHNNKIVMEREAQRPVREVGELELWGIWNQYKVISAESALGTPERVSFLD